MERIIYNFATSTQNEDAIAPPVKQNDDMTQNNEMYECYYCGAPCTDYGVCSYCLEVPFDEENYRE